MGTCRHVSYYLVPVLKQSTLLQVIEVFIMGFSSSVLLQSMSISGK